MDLKRNILLFFVLIAALAGASQPAVQPLRAEQDTTFVNDLLQKSSEQFTSDTGKAISLAKEAKSLADQINFPKGAATALKNIGIVYYLQGMHLEALDYYNQSLQQFIAINDYNGIARLYSNIGIVYYDRGDDTKALENYLQSLKFAELSKDKLRILVSLNNVGGIYFIKRATYDKALDYYTRAMQLCEELGKQEELGVICVNIGSIYFEKNEDQKALQYFQKALNAYGDSEGSLNVYNAMGKLYKRQGRFELAIETHNKALSIAEKENSKISILQSRMGLGDVYVAKGDYRTALQYYKEAEAPAVELQANHELKDLYQEMAKTYSKISDFNNAYKYQSLYSSTKDTLYNIDTDKKLGSLQFEFDLQKKEGEITLLEKDNAITDQKLQRQRLFKNAFMGGLFLAFTIAILIFRSYRVKVKTHKILDKQKNEIEGLLLNILPEKVANELQTTGHATPKHYESVSVMFTDFKGFTTIADKMSPDELVAELDACFNTFDGIIEKYNLEKIKTIGDSYMCAGGIPTRDDQHVLKIVKAGLEIQQYITDNNNQRMEKGLTPWLIRIGIHVGPVVAGVVGKKKYAYDIWGSTVNIASRMESNGEPGKVNISHATFEIIKDYYACSHRGKISAKNIGEIDMYFIDYEYDVPLNLIDKAQMEVNQ
jgi:class 3 adenylate cyclase/Tfp pilus assembly protein PilF